MDALRPTSTRVALARAIGRGEVRWTRNTDDGWSAVVDSPGGRRTVTRTCNELARSVPQLAVPVRVDGQPRHAPRTWVLTDAGRQWLAEAETVGGWLVVGPPCGAAPTLPPVRVLHNASL